MRERIASLRSGCNAGSASLGTDARLEAMSGLMSAADPGSPAQAAPASILDRLNCRPEPAVPFGASFFKTAEAEEFRSDCGFRGTASRKPAPKHRQIRAILDFANIPAFQANCCCSRWHANICHRDAFLRFDSRPLRDCASGCCSLLEPSPTQAELNRSPKDIAQSTYTSQQKSATESVPK